MPGTMKNLIADAFLRLAAQKNIDKITVKDLVETCNISRQTFYYHFQDLYEVIEWMMQRALQHALQKSLQEDTLEDALEVFLEPVKAHHDAMMRLMQSRRRDHFEKLLVSGLEEYFEGILRKWCRTFTIRADDLQIIHTFYIYGTLGLLLDYCGQKDADVKLLSMHLAQFLELFIDHFSSKA